MLPGDRLLQVAYLCRAEALGAAIDAWLALGAGPFWMLDSRPLRQTHRGAPTDAAVRVAMTFLGDTQLELLAPLGDRPSAWRDGLADAMPAAGLFHHVLFEAPDYDATIARWLAAGAEEGWAAELADGRRVAYLDARAVVGHVVEVIERSAEATAVRERMRAVCAAWDGWRPCRPYAELRDA